MHRSNMTAILLVLTVASLLIHSCVFDPSGLPDTSTTSGTCGNGIKEDDESCDGSDVPTCDELGMGTGTVTCKKDCTVDMSGCTGCQECSQGDTRCNGSVVEECSPVTQDSTCMTWQTLEDCANSGKFCSDGQCSETCKNECNTEGEKTCDASDLVNIMECISQNGCLSWKRIPCGAQTLCEEDPSTDATCTSCITCNAGEVSCTPDHLHYVVCQEDSHGCTSFVTPTQCPAGQYCSEEQNSCVQCDTCTAGETTCDSEGHTILRCEAISENCSSWNPHEECPLSALEACHDGTCIQQGDECSSVPVFSETAELSLSDFHATFTDTIDRATYCTFPYEDDLPQISGNEALFAVQMNAKDAITIRTDVPDAVIWAMGTDCGSPQCLGLETGTLFFGADATGIYYFSVELPDNIDDVSISIEPSSDTSCTVFAPTDGSEGEITESSGVYCTRIVAGQDAGCFWIQGNTYIAIRAVSPWKNGRFSCGGDTYVWLYDASGNELAHSDDIDNQTLCSRILYTSGSPGERYKVCVNSYNKKTPISPYTGIEMHTYPGPYTPQSGEVIFTELENDSRIELRNLTDRLMTLRGCTIGDATNHLVISNDLLLPPDDYTIIPWETDYSALSELKLTCTDDIDSVPVSQLTLGSVHTTQLDALSMDATSNDDPANWCQSIDTNYHYMGEFPKANGDIRYHSMGRHNHPCDLASHEVAFFDLTTNCPGTWGLGNSSHAPWSCDPGEGLLVTTDDGGNWASMYLGQSLDLRDYHYVMLQWEGDLRIDADDEDDELGMMFNIVRPYREGDLTWGLRYGRHLKLGTKGDTVDLNDVSLGFDISRKAAERSLVRIFFRIHDGDTGGIANPDHNVRFGTKRIHIYAY